MNDSEPKRTPLAEPAVRNPSQHEAWSYDDDNTYGGWITHAVDGNKEMLKHEAAHFDCLYISSLPKRTIYYSSEGLKSSEGKDYSLPICRAILRFDENINYIGCQIILEGSTIFRDADSLNYVGCKDFCKWSRDSYWQSI